MKIAVIGAGNVGGTLGKRWAETGHEIMFGVRNASDGKVRTLLESVDHKALAGSNADAAQFAEVVVFTTPWPATEAAIGQCGDLSGKIVIDATNPLKVGAPEEMLEVGFDNSGGEVVAGWAKGAQVFKSFNQVGWEVMANPVIDDRPCVMFYCGPDGQAKATVKALVQDVGFEAIDAGPLAIARFLEPFGMTWIHSAMNMGLGRRWGLQIARQD